MIVVTLPMSAAIPAAGEEPRVPPMPIVPEASLIKKEGNSGYYSVHFGEEHQHWVMLFQNPGLTPGRLVVTEVEGPVARMLPAGMPWEEWILTPEARDWQHWRVTGDVDGEAVVDHVVRFRTAVPEKDATDAERWNQEGVANVTRSRPTLPSVCGSTNPRLLRNKVEIPREIKARSEP